MFIKNGKRITIDVPFSAPDGRKGVDLRNPEERTRYGIIEIPDPIPPVDFSDNFYYVTYQDTEPYTIWTKKPIEQILPSIYAKIISHRDNLMGGGCIVGTKWFHSDTHSKLQQMALTMLGANIPVNLQWKTMNGSFVTMTQSLANQVFAAQVLQEQAIFAVAEEHKLALSTLTTYAQVTTYNWKTNWPEVYTPT